MESNNLNIAVGVTNEFTCSYLPNQQERLMVTMDPINTAQFEFLLSLGFRRSGNQIYRPHCAHCQACTPIRIIVNDFVISKRQKRTLKNNQDIRVQITTENSPQQYQLYHDYICARHSDGSMYPPTKQAYSDFINNTMFKPHFLECYKDEQLIAVAVMDVLADSISAVYSYFDTNFDKRSLGSLMILKQCELAQQTDKKYLYLGYQIDNNSKMNYKRLYRPHQVLTHLGWQ